MLRAYTCLERKEFVLGGGGGRGRVFDFQITIFCTILIFFYLNENTTEK
jgi:hypothetical protein